MTAIHEHEVSSYIYYFNVATAGSGNTWNEMEYFISFCAIRSEKVLSVWYICCAPRTHTAIPTFDEKRDESICSDLMLDTYTSTPIDNTAAAAN